MYKHGFGSFEAYFDDPELVRLRALKLIKPKPFKDGEEGGKKEAKGVKKEDDEGDEEGHGGGGVNVKQDDEGDEA